MWIRWIQTEFRINIASATLVAGRNDGVVYRYIYPPKNRLSKILRSNSDVRTVIEHILQWVLRFILSQKLLYLLKTNFWLCLWLVVCNNLKQADAYTTLTLLVGVVNYHAGTIRSNFLVPGPILIWSKKNWLCKQKLKVLRLLLTFDCPATLSELLPIRPGPGPQKTVIISSRTRLLNIIEIHACTIKTVCRTSKFGWTTAAKVTLLFICCFTSLSRSSSILAFECTVCLWSAFFVVTVNMMSWTTYTDYMQNTQQQSVIM